MSANPSTSFQPPQGYQAVPSALEGISVYAPIPQADLTAAPAIYHCPQCGAPTKFDVASGGVACEHCGYNAPVQAHRWARQAARRRILARNLGRICARVGVSSQPPPPDALRGLRRRAGAGRECHDRHLPLLRLQPGQPAPGAGRPHAPAFPGAVPGAGRRLPAARAELVGTGLVSSQGAGRLGGRAAFHRRLSCRSGPSAPRCRPVGGRRWATNTPKVITTPGLKNHAHPHPN